MKDSTVTVIKGSFDSKYWMYRGVSIEKSGRGYYFRTFSSDGFSNGYKGDSYKTLSATIVAIDEMLSREDVTVDCKAIVIAKAGA